ncbi:MAG TPA: sigma 54-interacting transcriptional regulator [Vicinamibacterales bacterium]|nr:sigma 54-interacting transcriptional regulator [Vicinamibacterales bacterium]
MSAPPRIETLGQLRTAVSQGAIRHRPVKDEVRENLAARLRHKDALFPGIIGYEETVIPQLANAILARHHFILLGLRGQAKTRILRALTTLLDEWLAVVPGSEINDDPLAPLSAYGRQRVREEGDDMPIAWLPREARYIEKLATPDVTIADMIGDIDPIKAARSGLQLGSELSMHFGLLPRANRGIFAVNELPDLAGKIQVGLFNILQEGDVQIKGYPVRLPLDVMVVFSANPEDYTARGKIITPLKDRIGAEIRTHYLESRADAMKITAQEAWTDRGEPVHVPSFVRETVEELAFQARQDRRVDKRSGVSQRMPISVLECAVSNAERRALAAGEAPVVPRIIDIYAALPSMTGKLELEYEGELRGADQIARELVRAAVSNVFDGHFPDADMRPIVEWFDLGGSLNLGDLESATGVLKEAGAVEGLVDMARRAGLPADAPAPLVAAGVDFVLEGLCAQKKISRSDGRGYHGAEPVRRPAQAERRPPVLTPDDDDDEPSGGGRKKKRYYN